MNSDQNTKLLISAGNLMTSLYDAVWKGGTDIPEHILDAARCHYNDIVEMINAQERVQAPQSAPTGLVLGPFYPDHDVEENWPLDPEWEWDFDTDGTYMAVNAQTGMDCLWEPKQGNLYVSDDLTPVTVWKKVRARNEAKFPNARRSTEAPV